MRYLFSAHDQQGRWVSGEIEAANPTEARKKLARQGMDWAQLKPQQDLKHWLTRLSLLAPPSLIHLALATRQLSVMLNSGIDVMRSLEVLQMGDYGARLNLAWMDVSRNIHRGNSLSKSLARHPAVFSPVYVGLVKAGESSGALVSNLSALAEHLEKELRLRQKLKSALVYPAFVMVICVLAVLLLTQKVLPTLIQGVFRETGTELPWMTQTVIFAGGLLNSFWFYKLFLPALFFTGLFATQYFRTAGGRYRLQWALRQVPLLNTLLRTASAARFSRTMGALNACGLTLVHSLELTDMVLSDQEMSRAIDKIVIGIEDGESLTDMIRQSEAFPAIVVGFTELGEETGRLSKAYRHLAEMLEEEIDLLLNSLLAALEPLMIGVMGLIVGYVVIAMFLPLYQMLSAV